MLRYVCVFIHVFTILLLFNHTKLSFRKSSRLKEMDIYSVISISQEKEKQDVQPYFNRVRKGREIQLLLTNFTETQEELQKFKSSDSRV